MRLVVDTALKQGGVVLIDDSSILKVWRISEMTIPEMRDILVYPIIAEEVQLFGLGKIALANKYEAKGILIGLAACQSQEITWLRASKWQKELGLKKGERTYAQWKKFLWEEAKKFYPCQKEEADAILMAKYVLSHENKKQS